MHSGPDSVMTQIKQVRQRVFSTLSPCPHKSELHHCISLKSTKGFDRKLQLEILVILSAFYSINYCQNRKLSSLNAQTLILCIMGHITVIMYLLNGSYTPRH